ncbi:cation:proton antiporter domain-containing protein [Natronococcus wangiae]|uniref:cation:proton antiporter domain-containing protein n=1 Tax=Natronococcus wangiae TaxID=3068275 RepID=UPI00273E215E|nr:cation:proton antiporter [Natronococcus sp. AD5]
MALTVPTAVLSSVSPPPPPSSFPGAATFFDAVAVPLQVDPSELEAIPHEELVWLFAMLTLLLLFARGLGEVAKRFGLPSVVGELTAGIVLGPSLLGAMSATAAAVEFTTGHGVDLQSGIHLISVLSWIGLIMLIILTGLETDLDLIVSKATEATVIAFASILVPFGFGFAFAWYLPETFLAEDGSRLTFSLFVAVAMSISAIPVIAKILMDMGQIRRNFGQITLAAGMINDTVGWILLALVAGLERTGQIELSSIGGTIVSLVVILVFGFTVGQRIVRWIFVQVDNYIGGQMAKITTLMVLALAMGSITHALELEVVLGAFIVGILVGQVNRFDYETEHVFEIVTLSIFAPIFFAAAGLRVDLGRLLEPTVFAIAVAALAIAVAGKFVGSYVGAKAVGLGHWEGVTMGAGLNARGAMEIIVALVGFTLGVLTIEMYSIIVAIAVITSIMAPPMLRYTLPRVPVTEEERERIEREKRQRRSFLGNVTRILLPTRGGADTQYAARLLGPMIRNRDIELTSMYVADEGDGGDDGSFGTLLERFRNRRATRSDGRGDARTDDSSTATDADLDETDSRLVTPTERAADDASDELEREILAEHDEDDEHDVTEEVFELIERQLGEQSRSPRTLVRKTEGRISDTILDESPNYDLTVLGEAGRASDPDEPLFSETVDEVIQEASTPTMVVSTPYSGESALEEMDTRLRRILLPTAGTEFNRHAAEIAFAIATQENAIVEIVHVVDEPPVGERFVEQPDLSKAIEIGEEIVDREAELGHEMGAEVLTTVEVSNQPEVTMVDLADQDDVDLIIMGTEMRPISQRAFYGHRVEHVIQNAPCPVVVLSSL